MRVVRCARLASCEGGLAFCYRYRRRRISQVVEVQCARVCRQKQCLRAQRMHHGRRIMLFLAQICRSWYGDFAHDTSRLAIRRFDQTICAGRVQLAAVGAVGERPAAALVPPRTPGCVDDIGAITSSSSRRLLRSAVFVHRWKLQCRDMPAAEANG